MNATTPPRPLFPRMTNVYLRALGELTISGARLEAMVAEAERREESLGIDPRWIGRGRDLLAYRERLLDAFGEGVPAETALHVTMPDGTVVPGDLSYVHQLSRRIAQHCHRGLALGIDIARAGASVREGARTA
jgi:hypothetical protein